METGLIKPVRIEEEMKSSYLDYAMSVIVSRALPDVRDGLKPVHRRILFAMDELGLRYTSSHKKSARIVGEVLGKYHPHGDSSVYDAMVRLAQDFSMRYCLVDGQGNFGSMDNDPPAAMRYTEAKLAKIAEEMLVDIDKETVNFVSNFDDSLKEPSVLPARLPNLLVNGSSGIAVGMATNIPPHNLSEVCDAINYLIGNPAAEVEDLMQFVKGPDFPTAGIIWGKEGILNAYATGQGKVVVRARVTDETTKTGRVHLIVNEVPYQTNKAALVEKIAELAKDRKIEGISEVRDESDRHGMRIVIELKKDAQPLKVLNNLYKYTVMQTAFHINMLALVDGQPKVLNLKEALQCYIEFRDEIITRRSKFDLQKAKDRAHILEGFKIALDNMEAVIKTIRESDTVDLARTNLMSKFNLSQVQAQAILEMQLRRLAHLEQQKITDEYNELLKTIAYLEDLLANPEKILSLIQQDVIDLKTKYGDKRKTQIKKDEIEEFNEEDLIPHQNVIVTLSEQGYIKRTPAITYQKQHRYGRGIKGMETRESDVVSQLVITDTHDYLLLFTNRGKVYKLRCYEVPQDLNRTAKGTAIANLLPIDPKEKITAIIVGRADMSSAFLVLATSAGVVKMTSLDKFANVRTNGLIAMKLKGDEELVTATIVNETDQVILASTDGKAIKFEVKDLRIASRTSGGVRGIRLDKGDKLVGMSLVFANAKLLTVTESGFGKLSKVESYPSQKRGGKGVIAHKVNSKTGKVIEAVLVPPSQHLFIITAKGIVIRISVDDEVPLHGRDTQGVHLNRLDEDDRVVSVAYTGQIEEIEIEEEKPASGKVEKTKEDKPDSAK
jgi:DNA gyrase subunit A